MNLISMHKVPVRVVYDEKSIIIDPLEEKEILE